MLFCGETIKKPRPLQERGSPLRSLPGLTFGTFGCFQGIQFGFLGIGLGLDMSCEIARPVFPFRRRLRKGITIPTGFIFTGTLAAIALLDDLMANPAIEGTPLNGHERTFRPFSYGITNHWNHPLREKVIKRPGAPGRFSLIIKPAKSTHVITACQ